MEYETMKIQVTQDDILCGSVGSCTRCPIAIAIGRAINDSRVTTQVGMGSVISNYKGGSRADLPHVARKFISNFDLNGYDVSSETTRLQDIGVYPFDFDLIWERSKVYSLPPLP